MKLPPKLFYHGFFAKPLSSTSGRLTVLVLVIQLTKGMIAMGIHIDGKFNLQAAISKYFWSALGRLADI